ncbi:MAG: thiamine pyrophosphate-binding protein [Alphaproteobacteria bacterium]|jgi:thiamine pyrophosphate-dependent acetolactate synthase large subunit-like protein
MKKLEDIEKSEPSGNAEMEWVSDAIAEMLRKLDLKYIAMNPGASYRGLHDSLVNYLGNRNPQMLLCLHEDHVVAIAHGYARVTDKPMGAIVHSNVGLMHGLLQIFNAWCGRVPIFLMGATGPVDAAERRPWVDWVHTAQDQGALLRHYTKWDDQPASVEATFEAMLRANQICRTAPQGPTYVCLDAGIQELPLDADTVLPDPARYQPGPLPEPGADTLADLTNMLMAAERPLFLMGRVSRNQEDWDRRIRLAEALGARVLTDLRVGAAFPTNHPLHGPPPLSHFPAESKAMIRRADVIVAFDCIDLGGAINLIEIEGPVTGKIVNCSVDSYSHNGWSKDHQVLPAVDLRVLVEPDAMIRPLLPLIEDAMAGCDKKWVDEVPIDRAAKPTAEGDLDRAITAPDVSRFIEQAREGRKFTLVRVGLGWASDLYDFYEPLDYLGYDGGGGLGSGPGMAIGAGLALRGTGRIPITLIGDGDFMQGATSLWTAAHYRIPALIVVINNRSNFNDEIHQAVVAKDRGRNVDNKWIGMRIDDPPLDLSAIAKGQGVEASGPVTRANQVAEALERAINVVESGAPYLMDLHVVPGYAAPLLTRARGGESTGTED